MNGFYFSISGFVFRLPAYPTHALVFHLRKIFPERQCSRNLLSKLNGDVTMCLKLPHNSQTADLDLSLNKIIISCFSKG